VVLLSALALLQALFVGNVHLTLRGVQIQWILSAKEIAETRDGVDQSIGW
jgi:hypothetical protein